MRIYHAAVNVYVLNEYKKRFPNRDVHVLRAHSHKNGDDRLLRTTHRSKCAGLYYDSGTYYFYKVAEFPGSPVNFNCYLRYLKYYRKYYDRVFNFDCDFGDEGFDTNIFYQQRLEDEGLDPVPVVHSIHGGEIEYYIKQGYEDVALGSPQITDFGTLAYVMKKFKGANIRVHLFGNTRFEFLTEFPIYSCDSSVWAQAARFGEIVWWNPKKRCSNQTDRVYIEEYYHKKPKRNRLSVYQYKSELLSYLYDELNITMDDLLGPDGALFKQLVNLHHYLKLEDIVNEIQKEKGFWTAE